MITRNEPKTMKFQPHPEGWTCSTCVWIESHKDSKRGHYNHYCRFLPVPAKIGYDLQDYWCGNYDNMEADNGE